MGEVDGAAAPRDEAVPVAKDDSRERVAVSVDAVMAELQGRVRERLRERILRHGGSRAFEDARLFADVERVLFAASDVGDPNSLLLPHFLGDPATWQLETRMRYKSHRGGFPARALLFVKRRLLMPLSRWLFEYSRDNFERQLRVNHALLACVQELAVETASLRRDLRRLSGVPADAERRPGAPGGQ